MLNLIIQEAIQKAVENKEVIKLIYAFIIILICIIIAKKSNKIFKISSYKGAKYFRNAFIFYGLAFFSRYFLMFVFSRLDLRLFYLISNYFFEFFLIIAGFLLLYSLSWKKIENNKEILNLKILIFYSMALLLVVTDYLWRTYFLLFTSQIIIFSFIFAISFINYIEKGKNRKFLRIYCFSMLLALIAWILNALAGLLFNWNVFVMILIYSLNICVFLVFLFGVINSKN